MTTDRGRGAVYSVEHDVARIVERGGKYDFFGSILDIPPDYRFGQPEDAQRFVDMVWQGESLPHPPPTVRRRKGTAKAHYEPGHVIAIPDARWALTGTVVAHEVAHAVVRKTQSRGVKDHGPEFQKIMVGIVHRYISAEIALLLQDGFARL